MNELDLKTLRELKQQLSSVEIHQDYYGIMRPPVLTVDGVILIGCCMIHPEAFKDLFGEVVYQELLKQPRVPNPFGDDLEF